MKVAIASDDKRTISAHFGRTSGFVIFEVEGKEVKGEEYRPNTVTGHAMGSKGPGHNFDRHGLIIELLKDCDVVISHGMGMRIREDLEGAGIKVIITDETEVRRALDLYLEGKLIDRPEKGCVHPHGQ